MPFTEIAPPPAAAPGAADARQALLVGAAGERYGIPLQSCREILDAPRCVPLPGAGPEVRGLLNRRGRLVTVLELAACYAPRPPGAAPPASVVILETAGRHLGLAVDEVIGIVALGRAAAEGPDAGPALHLAARADQAGPAEARQAFVLVDADALCRALFE